MKVELQTNHGKVVLALNEEKAPITVKNFVDYVESGHYDGTIFHRVIDGFMVQGGGFTKDMKQKPTKAEIQNEADNGLKNTVGSIAMARTSEPHSASTQFFVNVADNDFLNHTSPAGQGWGYAVFGEVCEGMEVVNAIKGVSTGNSGAFQDVPKEAVIIETATLIAD